MRFIHIADVHLGADPEAGKACRGKRGREIWETFSRVIDVCEKEQTDLLLIAGDLFHRQPLKKELKEVNELFAALSHTRVVIIAGNHDYIGKASMYRTFSWSENVEFLSGDEPEYIVFEDLNTAVYGFSYHSREIQSAEYDHLHAMGIADCEILLAHGGDEKHIPISKASLAQSGFDYIALGHIHRPGSLIEGKAVYAGALEPIDKNDTGSHGFIKGEIIDGEVRIQRIALAKRQYLHVSVNVTEEMTAARLRTVIRNLIEKKGIENIYKITLKGFRESEVRLDYEMLDVYGNVLEIVDETRPAWRMQKILEENKRNLIGEYIASFTDCEEGSIEYQALYEGVRALMESRMMGD